MLLFLFLIVIEGLSELMRKSMEVDKFRAFKFEDSGEHISHLLNTNDTLIIREKSWLNTQNIKANILLFEVMVGLKVNFHKSIIVRMNIHQLWLKEDVPIMENSRRASMWQSLMFKIDSLVGRINICQLEVVWSSTINQYCHRFFSISYIFFIAPSS